MIIDFSFKNLKEFEFFEELKELEEELLKRVDEIKEDLSIRVYVSFKIKENKYKNYEIEYYLDDEVDDVEIAINRVLFKIEQIYYQI